MNVGFTGTKMGMRQPQQQKVYEILKNLKTSEEKQEFHHGDCIGADAEAAGMAYALEYYIVSHPPTSSKNRAYFTLNDRICLEFEYLVRDEHIVKSCDILIAAPNTPYEILRSGTWTTVRYARKLHKKIIVVNPDGQSCTELCSPSQSDV